MLCLMPGRQIIGSIIDAFSWLLTNEARKKITWPKRWYMPSSFTKKVLDVPSFDPKACARSYWGPDKLTGKYTYECDEMYLSVNYDDHWVLCIINILTNTVDIYDTLIDPRRKKLVEKRVVTLVDGLHRILEKVDRDAYPYMTSLNKFKIQFPRWVPTQCNESDCGLYVCLMMEKPGNVLAK